MRITRLPISLCHANCPKCGLPTEFKMFESGPGGDFATYIGARTEAIYRVDLGKVHYQGAKLETLLSLALQSEGKMIKVPNEIQCKLCGHVFNAQSAMIDGEELVDTYDL